MGEACGAVDREWHHGCARRSRPALGLVAAKAMTARCLQRLTSWLAWEPPARLVLSWDISADWQYDPELGTEIEINFVAEGAQRTRVELEHRRLDRYGARHEEMRAIFDKGGDWGRVLAMFAEVAERDGASA